MRLPANLAALGGLRIGGGWRHAYDKTMRRPRLFSPYVYLTSADAVEAEARAVHVFLTTGKIQSIGALFSEETIKDLYLHWVNWLRAHRSEQHARDMEGLLARALALAPDMSSLP